MTEDQPYWKEWLKKRIEEQKTREAEQLARARIEAQQTGKEPFDFARLENMIDLRPYSIDADWEPTPDYIENYAYKYYVLHPEIMTLEEFAKFIEMMQIMNP